MTSHCPLELSHQLRLHAQDLPKMSLSPILSWILKGIIGPYHFLKRNCQIMIEGGEIFFSVITLQPCSSEQPYFISLDQQKETDKGQQGLV